MTKDKINQKNKHWLTILFFGFLSIFLLVILIFWTIVPYFQMKVYIDKMKSKDIDQVAKTDFIFWPYTYVQPFILKDFFDHFSRTRVTESSTMILEQTITKIEQSLKHKNFNPYDYLLLATAYTKEVQVLNDPNLLKKAENSYKKAIELSPKQQKFLVPYGTFLLDQNRVTEGLEVLKNTVDLSDKAPFPNFYFALAELIQGEDSYEDSLSHLELFFESKFEKSAVGDFLNPDPGWLKTKAVYKKFLEYFYQRGDVTRVLVITKRLSVLDKNNGNVFSQIAKYISETGHMPLINFEK